MITAKSLRYVAILTNWRMRFEDARQLVDDDFIPAQQPSISV
jgi:hypothetical protein